MNPIQDLLIVVKEGRREVEEKDKVKSPEVDEMLGVGLLILDRVM